MSISIDDGRSFSIRGRPESQSNQGNRESAASVFEHIAEEHRDKAREHEEASDRYARLAEFISDEVPQNTQLEEDLWEVAQKHVKEI